MRECINLNLPEDLKNQLNEEAIKVGLTFNTYINEILIKHIERRKNENANKDN